MRVERNIMRAILVSVIALFISSSSVLSDWDDVVDVGKEVYPTTQWFLNEKLNPCSIENGKSLEVLEGLVTRVKVGIIGQETEVEIIDLQYAICPVHYSSFCGSHGCNAAIATKEKIFFEHFHQWYSWDLIEIPANPDQSWEEAEAIIVARKHGSNCGIAGANYCFVALRWDGEKFWYTK